MKTQPEALRLIQHMDDNWPEDWDDYAIRNELRRLHALNQELSAALSRVLRHIPANVGGASLSDDIYRAQKVLRQAIADLEKQEQKPIPFGVRHGLAHETGENT